MADMESGTVTIQLPAALAAEMERLKSEYDRGLSVQQIVQRMCESYVHVGQMKEWEQAHQEEIEQSYRDNPHDIGNAPLWEAVYQHALKQARETPQ